MIDTRSLNLDRNTHLASLSNNTRSPHSAIFGQTLLLARIVHIIDGTTKSTSPSGATTSSSVGSDDDVLDADDVLAVREPVEGNVREDNHESTEWDEHRDPCGGVISNSTLDRSEDSSSGDAHDEDTGTATGMDTEIWISCQRYVLFHQRCFVG